VAGDIGPASALAGRAFGSAATEAEVRAMLQCYVASGAAGAPVETQRETLIQLTYYLLTNAGADPLGLSGLYRPAWAGVGQYWLGWFAVEPSAQGRGLGRTLLEATLALAAAKGGKRLSIETAAELSPAVRLYQRLGFQECGQIADYWGPGVPLLILSRELRDITIPEGVPHDL
jgi:ribosomal protein S18 acetylase RimI-like enzyme